MITSDFGLFFVIQTAHSFVLQNHEFGILQLCQTLTI